MTRLSHARTPRPVTIQPCPACGEPMRPERLPSNHDRAVLTFLRCRCGTQDGHRVERQAERVPA